MIRPIQRLYAMNKELDGDLEVRNCLDSVEDKLNAAIGPVWEEFSTKAAAISLHESMFGVGSAEHLILDMKRWMETIVKEGS